MRHRTQVTARLSLDVQVPGVARRSLVVPRNKQAERNAADTPEKNARVLETTLLRDEHAAPECSGVEALLHRSEPS